MSIPKKNHENKELETRAVVDGVVKVGLSMEDTFE